MNGIELLSGWQLGARVGWRCMDSTTTDNGFSDMPAVSTTITLSTSSDRCFQSTSLSTCHSLGSATKWVAANHNQPLTQSDCRPIQLVAGRVGRTLIPLTYLLTRIRNIFIFKYIFGSGTDPV